MKIAYVVASLFLAVDGFAADRATVVQPKQEQPNRSTERTVQTSKIAPTLAAQFLSMTCTDGTRDYDAGDSVCRAHDLWECQKDGHWVDLKKKC